MATTTTQETTRTTPGVPQQDNGLAVASMVLGIVSLTGFGLLTGIPALILGLIALRRKVGERGMALAGVITGGVATLLSLLFFGVMILFIIIGAMSADNSSNQPYYPGDNGSSHSQPFTDSTNT